MSEPQEPNGTEAAKPEVKAELAELNRFLAEHYPHLATTKEGLPPLQDDVLRYIHLTQPTQVRSILEKGFNYGDRHLAISSTARGFSNTDEAEWGTEDWRWGRESGAVAMVFDLTAEEGKLHDGFLGYDKIPGVVPADKIIGVVNPYEEAAAD